MDGMESSLRGWVNQSGVGVSIAYNDTAMLVEGAMDFTAILTAALTSLVTSGGIVWAIFKFRREHLLDLQAERLIKRLLLNPKYRFRTFKTIKHHLGGFKDDELRKMIVRAGGIRFEDSQEIEIWGHYDRVGETLDAEWQTKTN
ncbi:hypothetical protein [uncultured Erythrobacter sp.]|uniref:hypothetical protein n=1 Tax=uncultured Erythrobacter sp. TaxID=263913 RepID=UPI002610B646|nr:hypothetical protein [uncultured Erythrobacter sp.]